MHSAVRSLIVRALLLPIILFSSFGVGQNAERMPANGAQALPAPARRPVIGVALSGGGALGLAHIGALEWMEQNHIPVDRIAGTSMGGIVGAIYATGMSASEMHSYALKIDWARLLSAGPSYRELSYRRKQDARHYQVAAQLGIKHGIKAPNGLNPGQEIGLLLDQIALPYSAIPSFDELPTPFRCVATNMVNGDEVILKDGSLARALRASMAIPGMFTPVQMNGQVLADGGLVDNLPADVARDMGADVVLALDLAAPPTDPQALESITAVLSRSVSIMISANERRSMPLANLVVTIEPGKYSITDYSEAEKIIQLGYDSAARNAADLGRYAVSDAQWKQYIEEREARKRPAQKSADVVQVTGTDEQRVVSQLQNSLRGPLNANQIDKALNDITGQGQIDRLGYEGFVQNGVPGLRVVAHEKTYGPPFIDLAVNVNGSGVAAFNFAAGARVTFMNVENHGGEWRNDLMLGSSDLAATEFYQPIANTHFFVAPYAFASKLPRNAFTGQIRVAVFGDERAGGGFDLGYTFSRHGELRFGYELFDGKLAPLIGGAGLPTLTGSTGEFRARYVWDQQDNPAIPRSGTRLVATLSRVLQSPGLSNPIDQLDVQTSTFIPTGPKTSIFTEVSAGTTFRGTAGEFQVFPLGGPFRLGAYLPYEFVGNDYGYASLGFRREFYTLPQLAGRKVYWGGWYETGSAFNSPGSVVVRGSMDAGFMADTIVGPVAIFGSVSPTGQSRINFSVGRLF
ncbi:MAG: patatin-like phospholipase family protein [Candidatus Sulfotelmatobacter sp.]|jgi:NTE family protein